MQHRRLFRVCLLCDEQYAAGTYSEHAAVHVPKRTRPTPDGHEVVYGLSDAGVSQAEIARRLGVSRQRVHSILKGRAA